MRILLPSKGLHGQKVVHVKTPTFKDLYDVQDVSVDDLIQKYTFVNKVTDCDFNKVTYYDVMYIFTLLSFSLMNNRMKYDHVCSECGEKFKHFVQLGEQDIIQLKITKKHLPYSKRIKGVKYNYTIPTAKQILDAYDEAQYEEDEDRAFQDLQVASIMGHTGDRNYAKTLPVSVYAAALVFQDINYHGIDTKYTAICPKCHKEETFRFIVSSSVLKLDRDEIIARYASVQELLTFQDYMSMSIRAFNTFISELNKKDGQ